MTIMTGLSHFFLVKFKNKIIFNKIFINTNFIILLNYIFANMIIKFVINLYINFVNIKLIVVLRHVKSISK